jgi:hypothetical protein
VSKRPEPRMVVLGGTEYVLLEQQAYAQLDAHRRQMGARTTQLHSLRQRLNDVAALLDAIEAAVSSLPDYPVDGRDQSADKPPCDRHTLEVLLARRHKILRGGAGP